MRQIIETKEIAREDFDRMVKSEGLETFNHQQFSLFTSQINNLIQKSENYEQLSEDEKSEFEKAQEEILSLNKHVVLDWVGGKIVKSAMYTRPEQVDWERDEKNVAELKEARSKISKAEELGFKINENNEILGSPKQMADKLNNNFNKGYIDDNMMETAFRELDGLISKAGGHKYIRREGTPGNYRYIYTLEDAKKSPSTSTTNDTKEKKSGEKPKVNLSSISSHKEGGSDKEYGE
jgi:hypothetical protein